MSLIEHPSKWLAFTVLEGSKFLRGKTIKNHVCITTTTQPIKYRTPEIGIHVHGVLSAELSILEIFLINVGNI